MFPLLVLHILPYWGHLCIHCYVDGDDDDVDGEGDAVLMAFLEVSPKQKVNILIQGRIRNY